ncbi:MAG: hypothetical protein JEZ11_21810 [Desulfobacterales bacterium]|nr:hypothetical protein [Desulfobacterales bacterium]
MDKITGKIPDPEALSNIKKASKEKDTKICAALNKAIEEALGRNVDTLQAKKTEIVQFLSDLKKTDDVPRSVVADIAKEERIATSKRAAEFKDLAKSKKRGELGTNPGKLGRLCDDLNDDVVKANAIESTMVGEIDKVFIAQWVQMTTELTKYASKAGVAPRTIMLEQTMSSKCEALKKKRWKNFAKASAAFVIEIKAEIDEAARNAGVNAFRSASEYSNLRAKAKLGIIDKANRNKTSVDDTKKLLDAAMEAQYSPSKSQWTQHLGMTGYQIAGVNDKYDNMKIHITYDRNSWSRAAEGGISLKGAQADAVMKKLFETSVSWTYQMHATLEAKDEMGKSPHVYFGGKNNHWNDTAAKLKLDGRTNLNEAKWVKDGIAKMTQVLNGVKAEIMRKIKAAISKHGDI